MSVGVRLSVQSAEQSPSPFRPNGFLRSVSASAELSHALPCTLRREQLSPRLTSLTSNPQLLHSLHGLRQVIDHSTSLIGLNQTVSQTFYTRFPTCEMGGIRTEAERGEARGGLRSLGETGAICLIPSWSGLSPSRTRHINMGHRAYTVRDLHL